uniref:Secreted protein n=1 Tax=Heterorhabditis bacteriophora TaxID=37862 RepID=A0A1I7X1Y4_HETBA
MENIIPIIYLVYIIIYRQMCYSKYAHILFATLTVAYKNYSPLSTKSLLVILKYIVRNKFLNSTKFLFLFSKNGYL